MSSILRLAGIVLILFGFTVKAQVIRFSQFTTSDGLLSDEVYNIHQDRQGYLWCFTNYGVLKYNGTQFKPVLKNLAFNESFIYSIYENKQGRKWVASSTGKIYEIINDSAFVVKGTEKISDKFRKEVTEVSRLFVDDSLNIYAETKHDSYKFIKEGAGYRPLKLGDGKDTIAFTIFEKDGGIIKYLNYTGDDSTFCGGRNDLKVLFTYGGKTFYFVLECIRSSPKIFRRYGNAVYANQHNRLMRIEEGKVVFQKDFNSLVTNFTRDKNGHTWVACYSDGLYELNEKDSVIHHYFEGLTINDVLADSQNGLWVSSVSGLYHCPNLNDLYFRPSEPLGQQISFIKRIKDELFVSNTSGEIYTIKGGRVRLFKAFHKDQEPHDIVKEGDKYIVSTRYALYHKGYLDRIALPRLLLFAQKAITKSKDTIYFLQRKRFFSLQNGKFESFLFDNKAHTFEMRGNVPILVLDNGVWEIRQQKLVQPEYLRETNGYRFKALTEDSLGNFWFCSLGYGLFMLDPDNRMRHFTSKTLLPEDVINNISFDSSGVLLSTISGLYYTKKITSKKNWKKIYSGSVQNAFFFEDKIYLSTQNGLVILDRQKIYNNGKLYFNLRNIKINSLEVPFSRLNKLLHSENNVEFIFDLISFDKDKSALKYRLTGETSDSSLVDGNVLGFQKLPPGNYTLTVIPVLTGESALKLQIPFCIVPAFWQTSSFRLIVLGLIIVLILVIIRLILDFQRRKQEKKSQAERLIQEYRLIALKAQINPHFMSNCLTAIQHLIINNQVELATAYIAKFGRLVRQILNFSTRSLVTLKEELEIAILNIELEQLRFEKKFIFELKVQEKIDPASIYIPALIMNPIIENAIWHGLLPIKKERQGRLLIEVKLEADTIFLIIEDNGVGKSQKPKSMSNTRESKGLAITEQRLNNINYMYKSQRSQMLFVNLNERDPGIYGTQVIISLPASLKPLQNE